jgi:hypothetical protein
MLIMLGSSLNFEKIHHYSNSQIVSTILRIFLQFCKKLVVLFLQTIRVNANTLGSSILKAFIVPHTRKLFVYM